MLVTMTHEDLPGVERVVTRDAYRWVWWTEGWRSDDDPDWSGPPPAAVRSPLQSLRHNWVRDGWGPWSEVVVSASGSATSAYTVTPLGRGRITGQANGTDGNRRTWMLRRGTTWVDSEVCSLWWGGSIWQSGAGTPNATPQMGHVHRAQLGADGRWRGVVITNNIFLSTADTVNQNVWETEAEALFLGAQGGSKVFPVGRTLGVLGVSRFQFVDWFNNYQVTPSHLWGLQVGDLVTIDVGDATFDTTSTAVSGVNANQGTVNLVEDSATEAVDFKIETGTMAPEPHKRFWPYWVRSELRGDILRVKVWRYGETEPDWGSSTNVKIVDFTVEDAEPGQGGRPEPDATMPTGPGACGLVGAHLRSSAWMEYGSTTFTGL